MPAEDLRFPMPCRPAADQGHELAASLGGPFGKGSQERIRRQRDIAMVAGAA